MPRVLYLLSVLILAVGCGGPASPAGSRPTPAEAPSSATGGYQDLDPVGMDANAVGFTELDDSIPAQRRMKELVGPYRDRMGEEIREVIGETTGPLAKASPEGTLGNFAADAMLWAANRAAGQPVQMAMTNNGGLRVPIGPGPVTLEQMYELMPFDNLLTVLVLSGEQVQALCDELAELRGEPIAGFSFHISSEAGRRRAEEIQVGRKPLDLSAEYRLVTNDYLANGGGTLTPLDTPLNREDLPILLRDAFVDYVRFKGTIVPVLEGRITGGVGS